MDYKVLVFNAARDNNLVQLKVSARSQGFWPEVDSQEFVCC